MYNYYSQLLQAQQNICYYTRRQTEPTCIIRERGVMLMEVILWFVYIHVHASKSSLQPCSMD